MILLVSGSWASEDIHQRVSDATSGFRDLSLTARVVHTNPAALHKIGKDFSKNYDIKSTRLLYKCPDKMRLDGKIGLLNVVVVTNGDKKAFMIPSVHFRSTDNIKGQPHKRQSELDWGVLTGSLWNDYIVLSAESESVSSGDMYKIVFRRSNSVDKKLAVWADAKSLKLLKLEKYESDGSMKSKYIFSGHKEYNHIWVPSRIDVYNEDNTLAATSACENVAVNSGISDSRFNIK
jgi:outer membrane lipoprotein-sorting protein